MTNDIPPQAPWTPQYPYGQPPAPKSHRTRNIILSIVGVLVVVIVASAVAANGGNGGSPVGNSHTTSTNPPPAQATTQPAALPSPNGTFKGACDYSLGDNPAGDPSTAVATGDVEVTNTGNIGIVVNVVITWPQQGYDPLTQTKTGIQVAAGQTDDVQFNLPMTSDQVDHLQAWQTGHIGSTGCTYNSTITSTYGSVS